MCVNAHQLFTFAQTNSDVAHNAKSKPRCDAGTCVHITHAVGPPFMSVTMQPGEHKLSHAWAGQFTDHWTTCVQPRARTKHSGDYCLFPCGFRCNTLLFTLTSRVVCFFSRVCVLPLPRRSLTPSLLPFNWLFVFSAFSLICLLFLSSYLVSATASVCVICNLKM